MPDLLGPAAGLFKGAADTQAQITADQTTRLEGAANRSANLTREVVGSGIQQIGAMEREKASNAAAMEREKVSQAGASERQQADIEAQFITLTPTLKKGAAQVTGDKSWNEIPDGYKMRADVYSGLLSTGSKMYENNQPKTLTIQEGDQVYTAEYDPVTRKLRKLTEGGEKFNPKTGTGAGGKNLNPITLQTRIAQDEKTLLTAMGAKGDKGIPGQGLFGDTFIGDKGKAKLASYRTIAQRLKDNYVNLEKLSDEKGLQFTPPSEETLTAINGILGQDEKAQAAVAQPAAPVTPPAPAASTLIRVKAPNGSFGYIPKSKLEEKLKLGYTVAPK